MVFKYNLYKTRVRFPPSPFFMNTNPEENNNSYATNVSVTELNPLRDLYIPPEGIASLQEYLDLCDGTFEFVHLLGVIRQFDHIIKKLQKIYPELIVDLEGLKENPNCLSCVTNISSRVTQTYMTDVKAREIINELICTEPYLLATVKELNGMLKRQNYLYNSVHHVPKRLGAWKEFLDYIKREKLNFTNINVVDPGPQSEDLHVYIIPKYRVRDLI